MRWGPRMISVLVPGGDSITKGEKYCFLAVSIVRYSFTPLEALWQVYRLDSKKKKKKQRATIGAFRGIFHRAIAGSCMSHDT